MGEEEARSLLHETLFRWSANGASSTEVIADAATAVSVGVDEPWVVALACLTPDASGYDVEDVLTTTPPRLDVPVLPRGNPEALVAAAMAQVRRCSAGQLRERDLARWAHEVIGHGRSDELELLVSLDDSYDTAQYLGEAVESVDAQVRVEVDRLVGRHEGC